jgi:acetyl esterase/lipase
MFKAASFLGLAATLALLSGVASAEQGDSTAWGTVGWGPVIPTQSLTPKERAWNHDNEPLYHAGDSAEWLRQHGKGLFPFLQ